MSSIVPPQGAPSLNNFSFNTIGKEPDLLRRIFSAPAPGSSFQHESNSQSPPPINDYSQSQSTFGFQMGSSKDVQMQDSTPARRSNVNIFGQRVIPPTQSEGTTNPLQQNLFPTASSSHSAATSNQTPFLFNNSGSTLNAQVSSQNQSQTIPSQSTSSASNNTTTTSSPPTPVHIDIKNRISKLQSSVASATASSSTELATALDKIRNAETLAQQALSASQQVAKLVQVSLKASQGARDGVAEAVTIIQSSVNEFGKKEEQWNKVCDEMKADLIKLGDIFDNLDKRRRERQQELMKQREREEKERKDREKEKEEELEKLRSEIEKQKSTASHSHNQGDDVAMHDISGSRSGPGPGPSSQSSILIAPSLPTNEPGSRAEGMQKILQDTEARLQEVREMMRRLEHQRQEIMEENNGELERTHRTEEQERRIQAGEEEKKRQVTSALAEQQRKSSAEEEEKRKNAEKEECRRTEESLKEDLRKRQEARKSKSADVEGQQKTPSTLTLQQSSKSTLPVTNSRFAAPLPPSLPPKPIAATQVIDLSTPDTEEKKKGKGKQKATKANNTASSQVRPGSSVPNPQATHAAGLGPSPNDNDGVPSTPSPRSRVPPATLSTNVPTNGPKNSTSNATTTPTTSDSSSTKALTNARPQKAKKVKKEPVVVNLPTTPAVKKEQLVEDTAILQRANAAPVPAPVSRPAVPPKTPAAADNATPIKPSHSTQIAPSPNSIPPLPSAPDVNATPHRDSAATGQNNPSSKKRKRAISTNQPATTANLSNTQQLSAFPAVTVRQPQVDPTAGTTSLPSVSLPTPAQAAPIQSPATPSPAPANAEPANDLTDRLRPSPIAPDMQDDGGWSQQHDDRGRAPNRPAGPARRTQSNYARHYSPAASSSPRYARSRSRSPYTPRSYDRSRSRSRSRSPYYRRTPSPNPNSNGNSWVPAAGRYHNRRDSRSPPPRREYNPRKRPYDSERDTYRRRSFERSPSPGGQTSTLEARLTGDRYSRPSSRNNGDRPALLRRLRNSNEPDYYDPPPTGPSRRGSGAPRGRGRGGGGRGSARLAQRIHSLPSVQQSPSNLFDRLHS